MRISPSSSLRVVSFVFTAHCADPADLREPPPADGTLAISVSACAPAAVDICYEITVRDATSDATSDPAAVAVSSGTFCASEQGHRTDILVELPCRSAAGGASVIEVVGTAMTARGEEIEAPCSMPGRCSFAATCARGAATTMAIPLRFVATALAPPRNALSIAVDLPDEQCHAKLDTTPDLLFDEHGRRVPTAVLAVGCYSYRGHAIDLYRGDVRLTCDGGQQLIIEPVTLGAVALTHELAPRSGTYYGAAAEEDRSYSEVYWNVAIGLRAHDDGRMIEPDLGDCVLEATASAGDAPWLRDAAGRFVPPERPWPIYRWSAPIIAQGRLVRAEEGLDRVPPVDDGCEAHGTMFLDYLSDDDEGFCHKLSSEGALESCRP